MNKNQITEALHEIGAAWAVRSDKYIGPSDGFDAKPSYHIHPDVHGPNQSNIRRFSSLREIAEWIEAMHQAASAPPDWANREMIERL